MKPATIRSCFAAYGLSPEHIASPTTGYRNKNYAATLQDGSQANLIIYKIEPEIVKTIQRTNTVGNFLTSNSFPARTTINPKILRLRGNQQTAYASLYNYLPGETIPWEAYTQIHLKELGKTLGEMHKLLESYDKVLPDAASQNMILNSRMRKYFSDPGVKNAAQNKLKLKVSKDDFSKLHELCATLPNQQALHLDFVRGNVLFTGKQISGVIDFEKIARGHRILDVARTLAFLLVDCKFKSEEKIRKYFLESGYKKRGSQQLIKQPELLEHLVDFYLLHDFYKFLRHNPYESLTENEHFVRTKMLLLKRGILR